MDDTVDRASPQPARTTGHASRESEAAGYDPMLAALFDQLSIGYAILDRDFNYVRVNAAFANRYDGVVGRFPGTKYADNGGACANMLRVLAEAARTKKAIRVAANDEGCALNATGAALDWMVEPILSGDGELQWLALSSIDATEHKRKELELHQRASLYHAIVSVIDVGVICQSAAGQILS